MSAQDLLQVSYTLLCFRDCAEMILQMLCPFQSSWCWRWQFAVPGTIWPYEAFCCPHPVQECSAPTI